ncbi:SRPBCC family protein [Aciditerrimonas ferrireducens]|uniref:SRPBCC family protein n=1 Tax=Aciditerrimonas ferrireducens TaxID=667306 RepID=UPI002004E5F4|nr:SRPBCC family protein [Aciditerrimonas ferrireducens]MCK4176458.1 SRPBCC family protein [Aciditerrimonas ferrireducens]
MALRIEGSRSVEIAAPPTLVWQLVADVTRIGQLSPITVAARWLPPHQGPVVGARFQGTNRLPLVRRWTSVATVTDAQPGVRFAFAVGRDPARPNTLWSYDLEPTPLGCRVTERWQMVREPWIVLLYYRLVGQADRVARGVEQTLARLKAAAEAQARRDPVDPGRTP